MAWPKGIDKIPVEAKLQDYTESATGCWEYNGCVQSNGYSRIRHRGVTNYGHRLSFEAFNGPIARGLFVCHKCDNRKCINPNHLFLGTREDNTIDAMGKGRVAKGEQLSPLKNKDVIFIRNSPLSSKELANKYNLNPSSISAIRLNKTWKHIKEKQNV
ncbi:MAG: HNH endonuclease [Halanaerobiales bacterium]|nr:HNH endonuclease [Halanaerobiales bacterium]